jgi:hypothetical protein
LTGFAAGFAAFGVGLAAFAGLAAFTDLVTTLTAFAGLVTTLAGLLAFAAFSGFAALAGLVAATDLGALIGGCFTEGFEDFATGLAGWVGRVAVLTGAADATRLAVSADWRFAGTDCLEGCFADIARMGEGLLRARLQALNGWSSERGRVD